MVPIISVAQVRSIYSSTTIFLSVLIGCGLYYSGILTAHCAPGPLLRSVALPSLSSTSLWRSQELNSVNRWSKCFPNSRGGRLHGVHCIGVGISKRPSSSTTVLSLMSSFLACSELAKWQVLQKSPTTSCSIAIRLQRLVAPSACTPVMLIACTFSSTSLLMRQGASSNAT